MAYEFGVLRMDVSHEASEHNRRWLGPRTLGIEVTSQPLAEQCGLGNIDPQHSGEMRSSAIEEALSFPLPADGSKLVTIRLDKDSVGAMAVLQMRLFGQLRLIDKALVSWVGALDRHGFREAEKLLPDLAAMFRGPEQTDALNVIALHKKWRGVDDRVRDTARILTGQMPRQEMREILQMCKRVLRDFGVEMYGEIAFIEAPGTYQEARNWGNARYDIALIHDPEFEAVGGTCARWSIIRRTPRFDLAKFTLEVNKSEADIRNLSAEELQKAGLSWGGNANITSSPSGNGRSSLLRKQRIIEIALSCLS